MDAPHPTSASRRSTPNIPPKPDASLAEWTTKIKALQKQVDDDDEVETRRLEAEIAASRQARLRRSTNLGSRTNSIDLSQGGLVPTIKTEDESGVSDEPLTEREKQRNQDDALRKLMGGNASPKPASRPRPPSPQYPPGVAHTPSKPPTSPMSLAAFIGGRATGPRLTKHAPQQNAHDPTQFEQRTHISAPHPVFGRGGVAMPGMTGAGSASAVSRAIREKEVESPSSLSAPQRDRRISTPSTVSTVRLAVEKAQERQREIVPSYIGSSQAAIRQRTMSTPTGVAPPKPNLPPETLTTKPRVDPVPRPMSHSPNPTIIRPITPRSSTGSKSPVPHSSSATPHTPPPQLPIRSSKQGVPPPGLARPIQPSPRPSFGSPQMPPSHNASPAFLKPPPTKEPTPSISRLQGRGFVKKVVERSATLEVGSPESSPTPERTLSPGWKQSSVLDRWQHTGGSSPTLPPVTSPKPIPMRKSFTTDPSSATPSYSIPLKQDSTRPVLKNKSSLPLLPTMRTGDSVGGSSSVSEGYNGPKLGSAKTVITFIQPTKTGDQPPEQPVQPEVVDELGIRVRAQTASGGLVQERGEAGLPTGTAAAPSKPLSHPTKDRAKKPRKGKGAPAGGSKLAAIREASPTRNEGTSVLAAFQAVNTERTKPSLTPPQTYVPVRTTSPILQTVEPPVVRGIADYPVLKPTILPKPSLDVNKPPAAAATEKTSPTSPLVPPSASRSPDITPPQSTAPKSPSSPARHPRIPSTGNRATVMDVAQAFTEALSRQPSTSPSPSSPVIETKRPSPPSSLGVVSTSVLAKEKDNEEENWEPPNVRNIATNWGPRNAPTNGVHGTNGVNNTNGTSATTIIVAPPMEKRKSSYEKYSAFILPPLAEEKTPVASPAGTLKSDAAPPPEVFQKEIELPDVAKVKTEPKDVEEQKVGVLAGVAPVAVEPAPQPRDEVVHLEHDDEPLPHVEVDPLYHAPRATYNPDLDVTTISVEVMAISGNSVAAINTDAHVFYDSELLAVIHRAKVKSSGLVATKVWAWRGRRSQAGENEMQKVQELARRYGTSPVMAEQARETPELVSVLGGTLATRQGTRAHWSAENTAMHVVRSLQGLIYVDELDLGVKNLCSGYSYCISILDTFYVWHGRGSTPAEQCAALTYAQKLTPSVESIVELTEDESQTDEMFWMILGEGDYARADYWRWRADTSSVDPRLWVVDATQSEIVQPVSGFAAHPEFGRQVYLADCIWELFVLIGTEARGRRRDIRLALNVAKALALKASSTRPFTPTVHALVFPTRIPTDLLLTFRELDESGLNAGDIPEHMNLIPASDADVNLKSTTWPSAALQDHTMLPLGVNPSNLV